MYPQDTDTLPTSTPVLVNELEALLRASRDIPVPLDNRMILARVTLSPSTLRRMAAKGKLNRRFKRNRVKKVGRPKTHWKTKQKLKKANNRRNYLNNVKPRLEERKKQDAVCTTPPSCGGEGI